MTQTIWDLEKITRCKKLLGQALQHDAAVLEPMSVDFGHLLESHPAALCTPKEIKTIQVLLQFASTHHLPVTVRGNGVSQNGQSLSVDSGLILSMQHFKGVIDILEDCVWVYANTDWSLVLKETILHHKMPLVVPYNCNLSIAGVISAGGIGAQSFKEGSISNQVVGLEVVNGLGEVLQLDESCPIFHAFLGGQGRFGVITKVALKLRKIQSRVKTFYLVYTDSQKMYEDFHTIKHIANHVEIFCSPSIQGMNRDSSPPTAIAAWLYGMHVSIEFDEVSPKLEGIHPFKVIHVQEESMDAYLHRHNPRFKAMQASGQWEMYHPWYECFLPADWLFKNLQKILDMLPIHYATLVHLVPIHKKDAGFFMLPDCENVCAFMILNPGVPEMFKESSLQAIEALDKMFLEVGGKRYLSGYLGDSLESTYWQNHFGKRYKEWVSLKSKSDPSGVFCSLMHPKE